MVNPLNSASSGNQDGDQPLPSSAGQQAPITKILVYDTICSVYKRKFYKGILDPESADVLEFDPPLSFSWESIRDAPRNSILGYDISSSGQIKTLVEGDEKKTPLNLYYPFFSSHFVLPVKPGEFVFAINADSASPFGYWMTRIPGTLTTEDVNYSHNDRKFIIPGPALPPAEAGSKFRKPGFPNGLSTDSVDPEAEFDEDKENLEKSRFLIDDRSGYENIWNNFFEGPDNWFVPEPVPRLTKRPGDLILQGSNNSTIILGSDRGYGATNRPSPEKSNASPGEFGTPLAGSVDIVVGRGRITDVDSVLDKLPADNNSLTRPRVIENTRAACETDKDPTADESNKSAAAGQLELDSDLKQDLENRFLDIPEGDPDFINDAARIYVSMYGDIDEKMGIESGVIPSAVTGNLGETDELSSAALKADRIRIVARNTGTVSAAEYSDIEVPDGDIRIIKQGSAGDSAASIYLMSDGTVQVSGKTINFTRQEDISASKYGQSGPGPGGTQPYVRFSDLKKLFEETFAALEKMADTVLSHVTPGNGAPSPQLLKSATELKADLAAIKSASKDFDEMASVRIFGE